MILPPGFQYSQSSLQDFLDCRRRFLLRWIKQVSWPAIETEPVVESEHRLQLGARFHKIIQQYLMGIPADRITEMLHSTSNPDKELIAGWENFLHETSEGGGLEDISSPGVQLLVELNLTAPLKTIAENEFRLTAKYDLVAIHLENTSSLNRFQIYDWKTTRQQASSKVHPSSRRHRLGKRMQTIVYPYLLVQAASYLNHGVPIQPNQIEMTYWFTGTGDQTGFRSSERFSYTAQQFRADEALIAQIVDTVQRLDELDFYLTDNTKRCIFCIYRSLCNRGAQAGNLFGEEDKSETDEFIDAQQEDVVIDFKQIGEIEF